MCKCQLPLNIGHSWHLPLYKDELYPFFFFFLREGIFQTTWARSPQVSSKSFFSGKKLVKIFKPFFYFMVASISPPPQHILTSRTSKYYEKQYDEVVKIFLSRVFKKWTNFYCEIDMILYYLNVGKWVRQLWKLLFYLKWPQRTSMWGDE